LIYTDKTKTPTRNNSERVAAEEVPSWSWELIVLMGKDRRHFN
jgi:hypothetical protein